MLRWNRKRRGFTLVELVIVIAILGILAMYALPKYQGIVEEARSSEARAQLGAFRSALGIYYAKHHGVYPDYGTVNTASNNVLFAEGVIPKVQITVSGSVETSNDVTNDGDGDGTVDSSNIGKDANGGWIYDDGSKIDASNGGAYSKADVRLNSTDVDPADSNKTDQLKWYEY